MIKYNIKDNDKYSITYDDAYERIFALWAGSSLYLDSPPATLRRTGGLAANRVAIGGQSPRLQTIESQCAPRPKSEGEE